MESVEKIYSRMMDNYNVLTGNYPSEASDTAIKLKLLAGEISAFQMNLDFIKNQMFIESATGKYLDYHGSQRGLQRKQSIKAKGTVTFSTPYALTYSLTIPKGTVVAVSGDTPVMFETDTAAVISPGKTSASVACTACQGGEKGNVRSGAISVIVSSTGNANTVTNTDAFTGGTDEENDEQFRKRILDTIINLTNGTNAAYYKKLALSIEGVEGAGVIPLNRGAGTVDVFICGKGTAASTALIEKVQALLDEKREINTDVLVSSASQWSISFTITLTVKEGYDFESVKQKCISAIKEYVASLGVGEPVYISNLSERIYHIEGVKNHRFSGSDRFPTQKTFPVVTGVTVTKGST